MRTIRNVFDQYDQPENKLTHSLMSCLNEDRDLLKNFLNEFCPNFIDNKKIKKKKICVGEQTYPEEQISDQEEMEIEGQEKKGKGLPDGIIYDDERCIVIESKIQLKLTKDQLERHEKSVSKKGYEIRGLSITVKEQNLRVKNWKNIIWSEIYIWAHKQRQEIDSKWAAILVDYFDKLQEKMITTNKLKGSITVFRGINFKDGFTTSEGKHTLIQLMEKIRKNKELKTKLGADLTFKKPIKTLSLWDKIPLKSGNTTKENFHISIGITKDFATAGLTLKNQSFRGNIKKYFDNVKFEDFESLIKNIADNIVYEFKNKNNYLPHIRIKQQRYRSQNSQPYRDGEINFDIRTAFEDISNDLEPPQKPKKEWLNAAYNLMRNRKSNSAHIQFQVGVDFYHNVKDSQISEKDAHKKFVKALLCCKPLLDKIAP